MNKVALDIKRGLGDSLPIVAGFIPACFTFGLVGKSMGLGSLEVFLLSALVYAGASQFAGVKLLAAGAAAPLVLLLTLVVNLRYMMISLSFSRLLKPTICTAAKAWIGFSLTEEVYAVSALSGSSGSGKTGKADRLPVLSVHYLAGLQLPPYAANLISTAAGIGLAGYIPSDYLAPLNTSLYALLIALLVPQMLVSRRNQAVCLSSAILSWVLQPLFGTFAIFAAMLLGVCTGMLVPLKENPSEEVQA